MFPYVNLYYLEIIMYEIWETIEYYNKWAPEHVKIANVVWITETTMHYYIHTSLWDKMDQHDPNMVIEQAFKNKSIWKRMLRDFGTLIPPFAMFAFVYLYLTYWGHDAENILPYILFLQVVAYVDGTRRRFNS